MSNNLHKILKIIKKIPFCTIKNIQTPDFIFVNMAKKSINISFSHKQKKENIPPKKL